MVALDLVNASNAQIRSLGPGLVALFVGGTSGIGEYTAKAFVKNAISPSVYIVGRSEPAAERIVQECKELNKDAKLQFVKADVSELAEVDRVCEEIRTKEKHINLLVQTQGNLTLRGRDESPEGLDRKFTLNYYSRMRFISNLLPLLSAGSKTASHFSRSLSVLSPGVEGSLNLDDIELKKTFSGVRCANHSIIMNDFMTEEFSARYPGTSFLHSYPSVVNSGIARELPIWARGALKVLTVLTKPFPIFVSLEETGARQSFIATSGMYPPSKPEGNIATASGVPLVSGTNVLVGANDVVGSGAYLVNWNGEIAGRRNVLRGYREKGYGEIIWKHTLGIFERVEKINQERVL